MTRDPMDEHRLRDALHAEAAGVEPADEASLDAIRQRGRAAIVRRRAVVGGLGGLILVAGLALVLPRLGDDDQTVVVDPGPEATTTTPVEPMPTPTPTTPSTTVPPAAEATPALWPPPDHEQYTDPVEAARSFVAEYVGFPSPRFGDLREAEPRLVELDVLAVREDGTPFEGQVWSTLHLRQVEDDRWLVTLATSDGVIIEGVDASDTSMTVRGIGNGFEGTLNAFAVAASGSRVGDPAIITVDCCEALEPFEATIAVSERPASALVISSSGLEFGSDFAAVPIGATARVEVHLVAPDGTIQAAPRDVTAPAVLNGALRALLEGPTPAETDEGYTTAIPVLPEVPPALLAGASISDGVATVTLPLALAQAPDGPGGTLPPERSALMVEQLSRTVFQFPNIVEVEFQLDGSCQDFALWIGRPGECRFPRS